MLKTPFWSALLFPGFFVSLSPPPEGRAPEARAALPLVVDLPRARTRTLLFLAPDRLRPPSRLNALNKLVRLRRSDDYSSPSMIPRSDLPRSKRETVSIGTRKASPRGFRNNNIIIGARVSIRSEKRISSRTTTTKTYLYFARAVRNRASKIKTKAQVIRKSSWISLLCGNFQLRCN